VERVHRAFVFLIFKMNERRTGNGAPL